MLYETRSKLLVYLNSICYIVFRSHFYALRHPHGAFSHLVHELHSLSWEHFGLAAHSPCCWYFSHCFNCFKHANCFTESHGGMPGVDGCNGSSWIRATDFMRSFGSPLIFHRRRLRWCCKKRSAKEKKPQWITILTREVSVSWILQIAFNESKDMGLLKGFEEDRKKEVNELEVWMREGIWN